MAAFVPIYAISNTAQGTAFIQLNANKVSIKGLSKNKVSLPKQSARSFCKEWDEQSFATPIVNRRVSNFIIKNNLITP
jgi:hypothetical protein